MSIPGDGFNRLPRELVCDIFRLLIEDDAYEIDRRNLGLVCRRWWNFIESSPPLWTQIAAGDGHAEVRRALENSRGAMIDLFCPAQRWGCMSLKAFLDDTGPHVARWRSLWIAVTSESDWAPLTKVHPPSLKILSMKQHDRRGTLSENAITLFGGAPAPSTLKQLMLNAVPLAVEPLRPSGLVRLSLKQIGTISTLQLLQILRRSPGLEELKLDGNPKLAAIGPQASNIQPIELPKLVFLSLHRTTVDGTYCILSNIRIPNPRRSLFISANIRGLGTGPTLLRPAIAHLLHTAPIPPADLPFSVIKAKLSGASYCIIQFRGMELRVQVDGEDHVQAIFSWLVNGLGSEAAECPVHLILDTSYMDPIRINAALGPLIVRHVSVSDAFGDHSVRPSRENLYLAMAHPPDSTSPGWFLPQLESLTVGFKTVESQERLVSMLRARYQGATSHGETESTRPRSLRSVELRGEPRAVGLVEEIQGILGEANVFWANE
ncbi:hypothetical protein FRC01_001304 [Tulasnella sp. 417]|nr:hypothetical protein FRC01_001304 [Tulasnella sp. 417]